MSETWRIHHEDFKKILGSSPRLELVLEVKEFPFAHEAGVFVAETNELFITSNQYAVCDGRKKVQISKISLQHKGDHAKLEAVDCDVIQMGNGGVKYRDGILFCAQGSMTKPSGLFLMESSPPYSVKPFLTEYFGRPFNSVNDVVVHRDGSIWFTDPSYGHDQGNRPRPSLPNAVYRHDPVTGNTRAIADGMGRPNGICFSPDEEVVYVTDTDQVRGADVDYSRAASIYAFDVMHRHGQPFLTNRRLFALADHGIPDGIKCDIAGNVYSGCGDGINVWSPGGVLLGRVVISGGVANFCFGLHGQLFALNENKLWRIQLSSDV